MAHLGLPWAFQLQEQLQRFMSMNEDLRHKVAVVQAQLKSALEKKSDLEAVVVQNQREMNRRSRAAAEAPQPKPSTVSWHPRGTRSGRGGVVICHAWQWEVRAGL